MFKEGTSTGPSMLSRTSSVGVHALHLASAPQPEHRQHPYGGPTTRTTEFNLACQYTRKRKKRTMTRRKDFAQRATTQAAAEAANGGPKSPGQLDDSGSPLEQRTNNPSSAKSEQDQHATYISLTDDAVGRSQMTGSMNNLAELSSHHAYMPSHPGALERDRLDIPTSLGLNGYGNVQNPFDRQVMGHMMSGAIHATFNSSQGLSMHYVRPDGQNKGLPTDTQPNEASGPRPGGAHFVPNAHNSQTVGPWLDPRMFMTENGGPPTTPTSPLTHLSQYHSPSNRKNSRSRSTLQDRHNDPLLQADSDSDMPIDPAIAALTSTIFRNGQ
ncbi:Uu.00g137250.m01.CDS01 [Anthostomella pinea]|uniref:Uu.00g137250.m01.CDS01 n=1 Tax=Anthostomella pinea TaxID=933095 RepID=A0AAI8VQ87_9PEZI|nr:Uu.00g137250.m01.CDS01 [Anthostomella pinea]